MDAIQVFVQDRGLIQADLDGLPQEAYFVIPAGFDNHIAWNLGHIITTQQALHYRLSGLPTATTAEDIAMFKTGSSPATWASRPDIGRLLALLERTTTRLEPDYEAGVFAGYRP
jgi:hypothetical protein